MLPELKFHKYFIEPESVQQGTYILEINAALPFSIEAKQFANLDFEKGFYYYFGSAQKNIQKRLERHLRKEKKLHWHIDHITSKETNSIISIYLLPKAEKSFECFSLAEISSRVSAVIPAENFGNSDCKTCRSHLLFSDKQFDQSHFSALYQSIVRLIPSSNETSCL